MRITMPRDPSMPSVSPGLAMDVMRRRPKTAGISRARAMRAACEVVLPRSRANPSTFSRGRAMVSEGVRFSATMMQGVSQLSGSSSVMPSRLRIMRRPTSEMSSARSFI